MSFSLHFVCLLFFLDTAVVQADDTADLKRRLELLELKLADVNAREMHQSELNKHQEKLLQHQNKRIQKLESAVKHCKMTTDDSLEEDRLRENEMSYSKTAGSDITNSATGITSEADLRQTIDRNEQTKLENKRIVFEGPVAFTAIKIANQINIGVNQNIEFEQVVLNEGGGYHSSNGLFIAPAAGIYMFAVTLLREPSDSYLHGQIVHAGNVVAKIHGTPDSSTWDQGSQTVFIKLNVGEEVWIRNGDYAREHIHGDLFSSFSGYLLYPL
ncbi:multimerin-2-like [Mya arenaria]|uniref:multimerin-2-like n=1 Tax=Mya arenaria TaxID=6604 RepID=UPI0022E092AB|nr:multimerin-2-like [Mya arenaria]